ncbi:hypothetical protein Syun_019547 [Stephania yunnanensis]|uniref:Late embryogenesis abundant protein LEA-2 subgroup domain-containing protein n=1 Tax=Stephania yunnanensis TaxID=152371 RepID=A0AAP0NY32_9MAGN
MAKPPSSSSSSSTTNLASCILATLFLILLAIITLIIFFTLFKPKQPKISITTIRLPNFSIANNTATFTFSQYASVRNPNRDVFSHYDSSLQLLYSGNRVGFMWIPAGEIGSGRTQIMAATFAVKWFAPDEMREVVEVESEMRVGGRVRVLRFFIHHVETQVKCRVAVEVTDGAVLGFRC